MRTLSNSETLLVSGGDFAREYYSGYQDGAGYQNPLSGLQFGVTFGAFGFTIGANVGWCPHPNTLQ
jgi:hypothetical protein